MMEVDGKQYRESFKRALRNRQDGIKSETQSLGNV
jgi:hypothetical protein